MLTLKRDPGCYIVNIRPTWRAHFPSRCTELKALESGDITSTPGIMDMLLFFFCYYFQSPGSPGNLLLLTGKMCNLTGRWCQSVGSRCLVEVLFKHWILNESLKGQSLKGSRGWPELALMTQNSGLYVAVGDLQKSLKRGCKDASGYCVGLADLHTGGPQMQCQNGRRIYLSSVVVECYSV